EAKRLTELQRLSQSIERQAELETYLKHPWPRTQIIAAIVDQLPKEVQLERISIVREPLPTSGNELQPTAIKLGETAATKLDPAQHDLETIRNLYDRSRIIVQLAGQSDDPLAFHRYLEDLGRCKLFMKLEEGGIERVGGDADDRIKFTAKIIVRPGYGQPGGPATEPTAATMSDTNN
ncbi:MAG TPA: hypothetical protein VGI75_05510, partial [Pirellulales bacterium]